MSRSVERRLAAQKAGQAIRSAEPHCWPLPPEWNTFIPPQAVVIREYEIQPGIKGTVPEWNKDWLRGLEAYVRSIVRDELNKANPTGQTRRDD